ncbi:MAG: type II toxin-antitoxin system VapC family toxin [Bryobacteraceae bacterium]
MNILLDTCAFLWIILDEKQVSSAALRLFKDPANEVFLSAVSSWEIALKHSIGKLPLPGRSPGGFISEQRKAHGIETLPLEEEASLYVPLLPKLHTDPFDRMLICQSIVHGLTILTPDHLITQYPVRTSW